MEKSLMSSNRDKKPLCRGLKGLSHPLYVDIYFVGRSRDIKMIRKLVGLAHTKSIEPLLHKKMIVEDEQTSECDTHNQWLKFQVCLLNESDRTALSQVTY